ncbi:MAG TPA: 3',5'-cyclic-AMP phosphodiesterase [Marinobacter sp.]|nr:3',5'-cyclic-AMP phosphodiesterase [Marinobacter sp.]
MTKPPTARALRVLQLTDPHLMADAEGALLGVNTRASLAAVIDEVLSHQGRPDLILATGDLAQDASTEAYRYFGEQLKAFGCPTLWIAGNHDHAGLLRSIASEFNADTKHHIQGGWQFLMLDSSVPDKVFGELAAQELVFLDETLARNPDLPAMVCLHHHPVDIGSGWMEEIGLRNREALWQVIDRHPQVRVVLWGHVHQEVERQRRGVQLLATPSTCIQFATGSADFAVEPLAPGYRWLELHPSGAFATQVCRAGSFRFELDENSSGY